MLATKTNSYTFKKDGIWYFSRRVPAYKQISTWFNFWSTVTKALKMDISKIANQQLADYRSINPGTCFNKDDFSLSINEAYAVQEAVVGLRLEEGETVIGYKVAVSYTHLRAHET